MIHFRKSAAFLLSAGMLLSAVTFCGCNKKDESSYGEPTYAPVVPANPIGEDVAGTKTEGKAGDTLDYDGKVTATLSKVIELDAKSGTGGKIMIAEMTISNKSDKAIDCSTATHFGLISDDSEESLSDVVDISAAIFARQYYTALNSDLVALNQQVAAGETINGYVTFKAPADYKELKLVYTPYKYYSNDKVLFDITPDLVSHYVQSIAPANE